MADTDPFFGGEEGDGPSVPAAGRPRGPRPPSVPWVPGSGAPPEPVYLEHRLVHAFVKKDAGRRGCALCGEPKKWMGHHAYPESFNVGGSSRNPHAWQNEKKLWMAYFRAELEDLGLPKGLGRVMVEGELCFPTRRMSRGPDQGNYRHPLEKHLGDALVDGGWLEDDNWLAYSFGNLGWNYEKGVRWMRLTFFPSWPSGPTGPVQATLL